MLTGMVPIHLLIQERTRVRKRLREVPGTNAKRVIKEERSATLETWQQEWSHPNCTCGEGIDDAEHTLFTCPKFQDRRFHLESLLGEKFDKNNFVELMLRRRLNWTQVQYYVKDILSQKEKEERNNEMLPNTDHSQR